MAKRMDPKLNYDDITLGKLMGEKRKGKIGLGRKGVLSGIKDEESKSRILQLFLSNRNNLNNNITSDQLSIVLDGFELDHNKHEILKSFLDNPNNHITLEQLTGLLTKFHDDRTKHRILSLFSKNSNLITLDQLIDILHVFRRDESKIQVVMPFLSQITFDQLLRDNGLLSKIEEDLVRSRVLDLFFENSRNSITADSFIGDNGILARFDNDAMKFRMLESFLHNKDNHVKSDQLVDMLSRLQRADFKSNILKVFLENPNNHIMIDQLRTLIISFEGGDDRRRILKLFFENSNNHITFDQFNKLLSWFPIEDTKSYITKLFLNNTNSKVTVNHLVGDILPRYKNKKNKLEIALSFLEKRGDATIDDLITIIKASDVNDATESIYKLYDKFSQYNQPRTAVIDDLVYISKNMGYSLDSSEIYRIGLIKEFINKSKSKLTVDENLISQLQNFLDDIVVHKNYSDAFEFIVYKLNLRDRDILLLSRGMVNSKYSSIQHILEDQIQEGGAKTLESCLTDKGKADLKNIFGDDIFDLMVGKRTINLSDIFCYFDVTNSLDGFVRIINPDIVTAIRESFHPSEDILLISQNELESIKQLLDYNRLDEKYISIESLCSIVRNKQQEVDFSYNEEKKINFDGIDNISDEDKERLNKRLAEICKKIDRLEKRDDEFIEHQKFLEDEIPKFIKESCDLDKEEVENINKNLLFNFFRYNYEKIVYAITSEDIGAKQFGFIIPSFRDGCNKNIGSQLTLMVNNAIIKNVCEHIFYNCLQKIVIDILNSGGDVIYIENDPFKNKKVTSNYLSPPAFLKCIVDGVKALRSNQMTQEQEDKKILKELGFDGMSITKIMASFDSALPEDLSALPETIKKDPEIIIQEQVLAAVGYMILEKMFENDPQLQQSFDSLDFASLRFDLSPYNKGHKTLSNKANIGELCEFVEEQLASQIRPRSIVCPNSANVMNPRDSTVSLQ